MTSQRIAILTPFEGDRPLTARFMADLPDALADELPAQALARGRAQITQPADGAWVMARIARFFQAPRPQPEPTGP